MRFFLKLLSRLSLDALYRIVSRPFFDWGYYILRWRRRLAADNIARSFPELSAEARAAILKQSYRNLCDIVAEVIWSYGASPEDLRKRVDVINPEVVLERIRAGQSILLMTAHYCNWEWQVLAGNTWLDEPMFPVYKPQRVAAIDNFLREARGRFGGTPIPHTKLTRELLRRRSEAHVYAMVADQTPVHNELKYWTTFLHQDTAFFMGADAIARILQATVVFVEMQRVRRGYYTMKVSVIAEPPYDRSADTVVVERYVRALENEIRSNPANWLWIHRKWKYPKPTDAR
jgi:Kdo2-lipid IVA lauroyltransferase/acyltransferase